MNMLRWMCLLAVAIPHLIFGAFQETDYFLVVLVTARQLDYSDGTTLFRTMAKHPSDGGKNGDVGHAWVYVRGIMDGEPVYIEGGHSGELGRVRPKYFEGVMNYFETGYFDPTEEDLQNPRFEPNPVKYLWASPKDGFFQQGCGGHVPTYAAKVNLTPEQFDEIYHFMSPSNYDYKEYSITKNQCSSFATNIAAIAGLHLDDKVTMKIDPTLRLFGADIRLWTDAQYSTITFASPDILEASLKRAVEAGYAQDATSWYKKKYPKTREQAIKEWRDSIMKLPERWSRAFLLKFGGTPL